MTKTKILTFNYKSATLKRAAVRKAIKEVNAEYGDEDNEDADVKQTVRKTGKIIHASKSSKKG
jgi:hypothetical protein